jgi:hypothetical protein
MALKWKDKREIDVCKLSIIHDDEIQTVHDKKDEKNKSQKCELITIM